MRDATWILALISLLGTVFNIRKRVICFYYELASNKVPGPRRKF